MRLIQLPRVTSRANFQEIIIGVRRFVLTNLSLELQIINLRLGLLDFGLGTSFWDGMSWIQVLPALFSNFLLLQLSVCR